jgi:hypothetical protein
MSNLQKETGDYKIMRMFNGAEGPENHGSLKKDHWTFLKEGGKASQRKCHFQVECTETNPVASRRIHFLGKRDP